MFFCVRVSGFIISDNWRSHGHAEAAGFVKFSSLGNVAPVFSEP